MAKILIFTATYNESDNIVALIDQIQNFAPAADILVIDDASPDGTGNLLDQKAKILKNLSVIHRPRKAGLGSAHMLAIKKAIAGNYDFLITMDADFSHHPKYLPQIISGLEQGQDFVIGSRYVGGGKCDYGFLRTALSRGANTLAIFLLGLPLKETTTSYRGFNLEKLKQLDLNAIRSTGYSFFVEFVYRISLLTNKLLEVPIHFEDRRAGTSKISKLEIFKGVVTLFRLALDRALIGLGLRKKRTDPSSRMQKTEKCPCCGFEDFTLIFESTTSDGKDGAKYLCTNTAHASHGQIVRCLGCGLIFTNPRLSAATIEALYADVEDKVYLDNLESRKKTFQYNLKRIRDYLPKEGRLLDVGAYCGVFMQAAANDGFKVFGVEPSRWATQFCRERKLDVHCGTLENLPKDKTDFDVLTSWDVLEHVSDPMGHLEEINRRLKLNGIYTFSTLHLDNWFPRLLGERWPWYMDMHLYYFTNKVLKYMLEQKGFEVVNVRSYCHIITAEYFCRKLDSLGVPFVKSLALRFPNLLRKLYIPFKFGDIQLTVARKICDLPLTQIQDVTHISGNGH